MKQINGFMMIRKMYLMLAVLSFSFSVKGQQLLIKKDISDEARKLSIDKYKKHKKELGRLRKHLKTDAFPIYWMVFTGDSAAISVSSSDRVNTIFSNLAFVLNKPPNPSSKDTLQQLVFSALIYDRQNNSLLAKLSEDKYIYHPSLPDEALFKVAKEVGAKQILHIMNLFDNWPYFIIDKDNKIFVHYKVIRNGEKNYSYLTLPINDFFSSNENVIKFTKSNWLVWR